MNTLQHALIGLTLTGSDDNLLRYFAMLHSIGIVRRPEFVHIRAAPLETASSSDDARLQNQMRSSVEAVLPASAIASGSPAAAVFHVLDGAREDQLARLAAHRGAGLILLGYGATGRGKRSLARRLAMISPASVWLVPDDTPDQITKVLAPIDFSSHSADSLSIACGVSQKAGLSECDALHVFFDTSAIRYADTSSFLRGRDQLVFEQFVHPLETFGVRVNPIFEESSRVTQTILRVAETQRASLIVMSTRGRSAAASVLLGSETSHVLMETKIPILAVKHRGAHLGLLQVLADPSLWLGPSSHTN